MANSVNPDQTAPIGAVCSGSTLFASILNKWVMLGNYLQQTTFSDAFFLGPLRVNPPLQSGWGIIGMAFICQSVCHSFCNTFVSAPFHLNPYNEFH